MENLTHIPSNDRLVEVMVTNLQPGMFVAELDRPWLETPFAMQGFYVEDELDAQYVAKYCTYVYIDPGYKASDRKPALRTQSLRDQAEFKEEYRRAKVDFESASQAMERVFKQINSSRRVDLVAIRNAVTPLIDSVFRNREALAALVRLKDKDDYFYSHSLSTAVWSSVLGRHLGLDKETLVDLAMGASVMDVGMTTIEDGLLGTNQSLSESQIGEIQAHVNSSLKMLKRSGAVSNRVLNIVACHHERLDGSGYPRGMQGNEIPALARIVGLVDSYDAMTSRRPYGKPRSSFEAMQELQDVKDVLFQGSLVEHFVQTVGLFPTGSIVQLSNGEVGIVVQQNPTRRLRPKVVLILDADKKPKAEHTVVDLSKYQNGSADASTLWITTELNVGTFGIQPDEYFL